MLWMYHLYSFKIFYLKGRQGQFPAPATLCWRLPLVRAHWGSSWCINTPATFLLRGDSSEACVLHWPLELPSGTVVLELLGHVWLFAASWTIARQGPLSMDSPGKNTGVGCHFLLQGIFLTQGLNPHLLHWQADSHWAHREAPASGISFFLFTMITLLVLSFLISFPQPLSGFPGITSQIKCMSQIVLLLGKLKLGHYLL